MDISSNRFKNVIIYIAIVGAVMLIGSPFATASSFSPSQGYSHPYPSNLEAGDLVFGYTPWLSIIPGYWTHVGIIKGYNPSIHDWIVIEATPEYGIKTTPLREFLQRYPVVAAERVYTSNDIRLGAVQFAKEQIGKPYDWHLWTKHVYGPDYYCSELVWASYLVAGGIDLDEHPGWSWTYAYGVAPQEIFDDGYTYLIYYSSVS